MSTLDIILSGYSNAAALQNCISAIEHATFERVLLRRVIVVNNRQIEELSRFLSCVLPLKILHCTEIGDGEAANLGFNNGGGELTLIASGNVEFDVFTLERAVKKMAENDYDYMGIAVTDERGRRLSGKRSLPGVPALLFSWGKPHRGNDIVLSNFVLIKSEIFASLKGYNEQLNDKYRQIDFNARLNQLNVRRAYLPDIKARLLPRPRAQSVFQDTMASIKSRLYYAAHFLTRGRSRMATYLLLRVEPKLYFAFMPINRKKAGEVRLAYKAALLQSGK